MICVKTEKCSCLLSLICLNERFFLLLIFYIFFGPNLRLNVCEKLVTSPKMFIITNNIIITIIIIIITIIINIISFVSLCYCSFCTSAGRKPCTWSISHSSQSVCSHTKHLSEDSYRSQHADLLGLFHSSSPWYFLDVFNHLPQYLSFQS